MTNTPDYELLKDAYAVIDGIPDEAIAFGSPCSKRGPTLDNATVCSPEGWLAQHPTFIALGLTLTPDGNSIQFYSENVPAVTALAHVFRISEEEAARLFGERSVFISEESNSPISDKDLWLTRVRHHVHNRALSQTVAAISMAPVVTMAKIADVIEGEPK